jgi:hypothetical protein
MPFYTAHAEHRQECTELRQANLSIERQVTESIVAAVRIPFPLAITARTMLSSQDSKRIAPIQ